MNDSTDAVLDLVVDPDADTPPFEQVRAQVAARAASGALPAGTRLPTVRALAAELRLAVNTVARAYRELEADGVVQTRGRAGTVVSATGSRADTDAAAQAFVAAVRRAGLTRAEATLLVERAWPR